MKWNVVLCPALFRYKITFTVSSDKWHVQAAGREKTTLVAPKYFRYTFTTGFSSLCNIHLVVHVFLLGALFLFNAALLLAAAALTNVSFHLFQCITRWMAYTILVTILLYKRSIVCYYVCVAFLVSSAWSFRIHLN